jgi:hypothetical protein
MSSYPIALTSTTGLSTNSRSEPWADYFANYTRVVWLAQHRSEPLERQARDIARLIGAPLTVLPVGTAGLESELESLVNAASSS